MLGRSFGHLCSDETGATAIEYALLAGLLAVVVVGSGTALGRAVTGYYSVTNAELVEHMGTPVEPEQE